MSFMNRLSRKRLLLWVILGIFIIAAIALIRPFGKKGQKPITPTQSLLQEALSQVPENIPSRQFDLQQWKSSLDVPVYFIPTPELDMLDIELSFTGGSSRDGLHAGLSALTVELLESGSVQKTADEIARSIEKLGSEYFGFSDQDRTRIHLKTLSGKNYLSPSISLLTEIISQPAFRKDDFDRLKRQQLQTVESLAKDPEYQSQLYLDKFLYPDHPYASPGSGTEESLARITLKDVQDFHRTYYVTRNLSIVMVGNITREQAEQISEQISLSLPVGAAAAAIPPPKIITSGVSRHIPVETEQVYISMGFQGINRTSPDYPALYVASYIFGGGGLSSILMEQLREQQGLVYGAFSSPNTGSFGGSFIISTQTRAAEADRTASEIKRLLHDFLSQGPTEQQLRDAKKTIASSFLEATASNAALAQQFSEIAFYNLPNDELDRFLVTIEQLTTADIKKVLDKVIFPERMVMVTAGPEQGNKSAD